MRVLTDLLPGEFCAEAQAQLGFTERNARRAYAHVVRQGNWDVRDIARERLAAAAAAWGLPSLKVVDRRRSLIDGFTKYLFELHDGELVEAVRIPLFDEKYVVCISSQAG